MECQGESIHINSTTTCYKAKSQDPGPGPVTSRLSKAISVLRCIIAVSRRVTFVAVQHHISLETTHEQQLVAERQVLHLYLSIRNQATSSSRPVPRQPHLALHLVLTNFLASHVPDPASGRLKLFALGELVCEVHPVDCVAYCTHFIADV